MIISIDMDGVIADFEKGFLNKFKEKYPEEKYIPLDKRTTFYMEDQYPENLRELIKSIYIEPNFFKTLPIILGSLEALTEIEKLGHNVIICTSPLSKYENCVLEKYQWIENNFGKEWIKKIVLTKDKTIIKSDLLIDDRPEIKGIHNPVWEHIIYEQPYNSKENSKRRLNWGNWKSVLKL